jgi:flagellar FliJ protein
VKALSTLIKLYSRQLDEGRREMVVLEEQRQKMELRLQEMQAELLAEQTAVIQQPESRFAYSNYAKFNSDQQQRMIQAIGEMDVKIYTLAHHISLLFSEVKKFEIARENKIRRQELEEEHKEEMRLGDIALGNFSRKEQEE